MCVLLAGCATDSTPVGNTGADSDLILYRYENDDAFTVKFASNSAANNINRGYEVVCRTAGGLTAAQTVYSNPRMRAEFGLVSTGKEAILRYFLQPMWCAAQKSDVNLLLNQ